MLTLFDYKILLAILASVIGFFGYIPYYRDIFAGKTKPHIFSWFVWGLVTGIAFFAQITEGGGAGAWVTGFTSALCISIAIVALFKGEKTITKTDWISFVGALFAIILWIATDNPLTAVILVTVIDALAFIPTFCKTYKKPNEETVVMYALSGLKFAIGLAALESLNLTTWLYPAYLVFMNGSFTIMVVYRRKKMSRVP